MFINLDENLQNEYINLKTIVQKMVDLLFCSLISIV
jgi:hypothetical protein